MRALQDDLERVERGRLAQLIDLGLVQMQLVVVLNVEQGVEEARVEDGGDARGGLADGRIYLKIFKKKLIMVFKNLLASQRPVFRGLSTPDQHHPA